MKLPTTTFLSLTEICKKVSSSLFPSLTSSTPDKSRKDWLKKKSRAADNAKK